MAEQQITDAQALANSAQIVGPGVQQPADDTEDWDLELWRSIRRLADALRAAAGLEVVKDDSAVLRILIRAGRLGDGATAYAFAELGNQAVVANSTNYVYLTAADLAGHTVTINQTAFPDPATTPHVPLATVACGAVDFAYTDIVDMRGEALLALLAGMTAADANTLTGGGNADALHLHTAAGFADGSVTDVKLALRYPSRPASVAFGAVYFTGRPADAEILTIDGVRFEVDKDNSFPDAVGDFCCDCNGSGDLAGDIAAIAAAVAANSLTVWACADAAHNAIWLSARAAGVAGNVELASGLSHSTVSGATLTDGKDAAAVAMYELRHELTATEAAAGALMVQTGSMAVTSVMVGMEDVGVVVAIGATITVGVTNVLVVMGTPAWSAGDRIVIWAFGTA